MPAGAGQKNNDRNDVIDNTMMLIVTFEFVYNATIIIVMIELYCNVATNTITL
jgi:hypothetical protein